MLVSLMNFKVRDVHAEPLHNGKDFHSIQLGQHSCHLRNNGGKLLNAMVSIVGIVASILVS